MMGSIARRASCLGLGMLCAAAGAQDGDGTARVQRDADNPMRMILEAGKLKPRAKPEDPDAAPKPLSMRTTAMPDAHEFSIASSAATPPNDAP